MSDLAQSPTRLKWKVWAAWLAQILLAVGFAAAGVQKLISTDAMVALFAQLSDGSWFRYAVGLVEVMAAALLLFPATAFFGALIAAFVVFGAIVTHLFFIGGSVVPALVLGALAVTVLILRQPAHA